MYAKKAISIHAPRVRCDIVFLINMCQLKHFNPRTSCEVRQYISNNVELKRAFQSTHLVWGATKISQKGNRRRTFQSTHLVWGATLMPGGIFTVDQYFNPRTSCEVRQRNSSSKPLYKKFQSTHLVWGATRTGYFPFQNKHISIHAPRVRCDIKIASLINEFLPFQSTHLVWGATLSTLSSSAMFYYFNPRTSCEVRHIV